MPFAPITLLAALIATAWFAFVTSASRTAKVFVTSLCVCSLALKSSLPGWELAGLLLQVVLVIGVSLYAKVQR